MKMQTPKSLNDLLHATSRSFYLTLRVLPAAVRPQIGLAYLLARTTDTIADTEILPVEQRLNALQKLRERILGQSSAPLNFGELAEKQNLSAEKSLLERVEASLAALKEFADADQKLMRNVLTTITDGQEMDLQRFGNLGSTASRSASQQIIALETPAELDDYTYRVAGCVGEFWTRLCRAHLFPHAKLDEEQFIADGIRFGKGLQLVNILRDLPADLKNGRCYLPAERLEQARLFSGNFTVAGGGFKISAAVPRISRQGGSPSRGGLGLHEPAAVFAIPRAAGVCVAGFDRHEDD